MSVTVLPGWFRLLLQSYLAGSGFCYSLTWLFQVPELQSNLARPSGGEKAREKMSEKLLLLDRLVRMENDVMEPKRKRSFPGGNTPLDRLSISGMDTKQASKKR